MGDVQPLPGYCLLLADPVVESLNALDIAGRDAYLRDVVRVGDALLAATDAYRINYETWCNAEPALHTHIMPRFLGEPDEKRRMPACMVYDWKIARPFDSAVDGALVKRLRLALQ